jgi:hypothetical protein
VFSAKNKDQVSGGLPGAGKVKRYKVAKILQNYCKFFAKTVKFVKFMQKNGFFCIIFAFFLQFFCKKKCKIYIIWTTLANILQTKCKIFANKTQTYFLCKSNLEMKNYLQIFKNLQIFCKHFKFFMLLLLKKCFVNKLHFLSVNHSSRWSFMLKLHQHLHILDQNHRVTETLTEHFPDSLTFRK